MKKILVGICGIGNGHINRQSCIIKELQKKDVQIVIATTKNKVHIMEKRFPDIKVTEINIPWIFCNGKGVDYEKTLEKYRENKNDQYLSFLNFAVQIEKIFNGKPDLVISDYEPNVAKYSYSTSIPLICMEQQAKFIYLGNKEILDYSRREEIDRLNYFFPKFDLRIISSFFPVDIKKSNVVAIPPIIPELEKKEGEENVGLVYLSPYSRSEKYTKILYLLSKIENIKFVIYTNLNFPEFKKFKNITFKKFSNTFKENLSCAKFLITTSGHQLLSEALSINIPVYTFPLDTYEQHYNCLMIEKYKLGKMAKIMTEEEFSMFYKNIEKYKNNIMDFKNKYYRKSWKEAFNELLDKVLN